MATLYVENIPDKLYAALRDQARRRRKSIAAEILAMLEQNVVTPQDLKARQSIFRKAQKMRSVRPRVSAQGADSVTLLREDRNR